MIYDFQKYIVIEYSGDKDEYGQKRVRETGRRMIDMMVRANLRMNVSDIRFVDATDIGLTYDTAITDNNQIVSTSGITYDVLYTIPSKRLTTIFLKRVN